MINYNAFWWNTHSVTYDNNIGINNYMLTTSLTANIVTFWRCTEPLMDVPFAHDMILSPA